ncbi:hypothetical protein DL98DRAFT_56678 [Cadophora sp. DSE1049]|nr:hypothetical protein DL98DRAFT_56678 [Cadophora sp. DSE1049]
MSGASRSCYAKSWDPVFSTPREFNDDFPRSYTDKKRELGAAGDGIELFLLDDVEGSDPDDTVEELKKFTASVTLEDLNAASETTGQRQGAWLDVRSSLHSGNTSQTFTASRLYVHLKRRRIGNQNALVANRCLTYIKKLDALYMLALAEMAAQHEVPLLRDAFRKHHNRQTSLQVTISANFKVFQLQFHLNYFKLGPLPPENEADHRGTTSNTGKWIDLSFLQAQTPKSPGGRTQGMFQAQFSLAICGSAESRWAAYAFDDTESEFVEDDFYDKIFPCGRDGYHPDPIASCLPDDDTDADLPIWNSREYFLIVVARRVARAAHSWEALVRLVERRIKEHGSTPFHFGTA